MGEVNYLLPKTAQMLADGIEKLTVPSWLCSEKRYQKNLIDNASMLLKHIYDSGYEVVVRQHASDRQVTDTAKSGGKDE